MIIQSNYRKVNETAAREVASALSQFAVDAQITAIYPQHYIGAARKVLRALEAAGYKVTRR